jgi:hypothetical protein
MIGTPLRGEKEKENTFLNQSLPLMTLVQILHHILPARKKVSVEKKVSWSEIGQAKLGASQAYQLKSNAILGGKVLKLTPYGSIHITFFEEWIFNFALQKRNCLRTRLRQYMPQGNSFQIIMTLQVLKTTENGKQLGRSAYLGTGNRNRITIQVVIHEH